MNEPPDKNNVSLHVCQADLPKGVSIHVSGTNGTLLLRREATEADLEKSVYLENVGDTLWDLAAEISYCPYCGEKLFSGVVMGTKTKAGANPSADPYGHFQLTDHSTWMSKVR